MKKIKWMLSLSAIFFVQAFDLSPSPLHKLDVTRHLLFGRIGKISEQSKKDIWVGICQEVIFNLVCQENYIPLKTKQSRDHDHCPIFGGHRCLKIQFGKCAWRDNG